MKRLRKWVLYIVYTLVVTGFFLYYLFPSQAAIDYISNYLDSRYPDYTLTIAEIKPAFPPGLVFESVRIAYQGDDWAELDQFRVRPRYMSVFSPRKRILFNADAYSGEIRGTIDVEQGDKNHKINATADISEIRIGDITHIQELSGRKIAGVLNSSINYTGDTDMDGKVGITVRISDCEIGLANPVFSINNIAFDSIDAELSVDQRQLLLKHCNAAGNQVDGKLTGVVVFRNPFGKSRLDLKGNVTPHHLLMASLKKVMPESLLPKKKPGEKGYPLKLYGTIEKPRFSLR